MFTGLVQAIGTVQSHSSNQLQISWAPGGWPEQAGPVALGDSIAVDGVCLTVSTVHTNGFTADVSAETLSRTTLGERAQRGEPVNLEPALRLSDRLGGHLVSGHVDGLGQVEAIAREGESWRLGLRWQDSRYGRYISDKASVAVNGISLTVAGASEEGQRFWIAVIPHTWGQTTLQHLKPGDLVNLEADLLAKYAERLLRHEATAELSSDWLQQHGWR